MKKAEETEIRAEVENLRSLDKEDLLGRMIAWRIQEKFYGGYDKATIKLLDGLVRGEAEKLAAGPRLKPGTVLMREHCGVRHTVTVVLNGFVWQGQTFPSLTTVARAITGTSWNGPRFFGLRIKRDADQVEAGQ